MNPQPGDFGVTATGGTAAKVIRWATNSPVNHAFIYVGGGYIIEADPAGAKVNHLDAYPHASYSTGAIALTDVQRLTIVDSAHDMIGTPYGWLDIAAIGLAQRRTFGLVHAHAPINDQPWWVRRIESLDTLICSQLVDLAYEHAGVHLFADGRIPGLVSPGDLYGLLQTEPVEVTR